MPDPQTDTPKAPSVDDADAAQPLTDRELADLNAARHLAAECQYQRGLRRRMLEAVGAENMGAFFKLVESLKITNQPGPRLPGSGDPAELGTGDGEKPDGDSPSDGPPAADDAALRAAFFREVVLADVEPAVVDLDLLAAAVLPLARLRDGKLEVVLEGKPVSLRDALPPQVLRARTTGGSSGRAPRAMPPGPPTDALALSLGSQKLYEQIREHGDVRGRKRDADLATMNFRKLVDR
jgi:hypothetical protein